MENQLEQKNANEKEFEDAGRRLCEIVLQRANELANELTEKFAKELHFYVADVRYLYVADDGSIDEPLKKLIEHIVAIGVMLELLVQQRDEYFKALNSYLAPLVEDPAENQSN